MFLEISHLLSFDKEYQGIHEELKEVRDSIAISVS